jgi:coenzyme F420 hydrogenase subunit beta
MIQTLIPKDLCTRCGACFAADTNDVLAKDEEGFPVIDSGCIPEQPHLLAACAGENWNYREILDYVRGQNYKYQPMQADKGQVLRMGIAYSSDSLLLGNGQSGGVSTTIFLAALNSGIIQKVGAVRRPLPGSARSPFVSEPFIASSKEELLSACGSKYSICSTLELIPDLENANAPYALSLLPCQTVGYHRLCMADIVKSAQRCKFIIGPFCGFNMEAKMGIEVAEALGLDSDSIEQFQNRSGEFPGITTFTTKDGNSVQLDRTAHRAFYRMYTPTRCFTCTDFTNELADISVADCWLYQNGNYKYPQGAAWVLVRTTRGLIALENAIKSSLLCFHEVPIDANDTGWHESIMHRKVRTYGRIEELKKQGRFVPTFDYPIYPVSSAIRRSNRSDLFFIHVFRSSRIRKLFLSAWISIHRDSASRTAKEIATYLGRRVFTHRSDNDRPSMAILHIMRILFSNFVVWAKIRLRLILTKSLKFKF